ncbi:MAG: hypothetical protein KBT22_03325 [Bacteroidales bacterium]|nr:hypothetical protein [Candidatus Scybalocola fimicaballi]
MIKEILLGAAELGPKVISWLELAAKNVDEFLISMDNIFPDSNHSYEVVEETVSKDIFFDYVRKFAVPEATGMAVIYKNEGDNQIFYFASVKDKELIDEKSNKFGAIKATDGVKKEVKELFSSALETEFGKLLIIR